jgi:DNA-directed RNA polymerase specialized sigma24 family protein
LYFYTLSSYILPHTQKISDQQLISLLSNPDSGWAGVLYDNYAAVLYGVIFRIVRNESVAEDLLHDAFQQIQSSIQQYDPMRGKLFLWMINICRTLALNNASKTGSSQPHGVTISRGVTDKLEVDYKVMIDLLFIQGYSQVEVADELNIPLGTVKSRSRAAIQRLRTLIQSDTIQK